MGQWEDQMRNAIDSYYGYSSVDPYKGLTNRALGALANAAWERRAQEEAEKKRLLDVQKQKDADDALERKLILEERQMKLDALKQAQQENENQKRSLEVLQPYRSSFSFDGDTGENVTSGSVPLSPSADALLAATSGIGLPAGATAPVANAVDSSLKALSLYNADPERYKELSKKTSVPLSPSADALLAATSGIGLPAGVTAPVANAVDSSLKALSSFKKSKVAGEILSDVLPPYEFNYEFRNTPKDVYKDRLNQEIKQYVSDNLLEGKKIIEENKNLRNDNDNATKENIAKDKNRTTLDNTKIKADSKEKIQDGKNETAIKKTEMQENGKNNRNTENNNTKINTTKINADTKWNIAELNANTQKYLKDNNISRNNFNNLYHLFLKYREQISREAPNETSSQITTKAKKEFSEMLKMQKNININPNYVFEEFDKNNSPQKNIEKAIGE